MILQKLLLIIILAAAAALTNCQDFRSNFGGQGYSNSGTANCFKIVYGGRLVYNSSRYNGTNTMYRLTFKSRFLDGVLLYAGGESGDYEGLFLRNGFLNYFIFNPSHDGMSLHGIHINTTEKLALGVFHKVEFFHNRVVKRIVGDLYYSTGMKVNGNNVKVIEHFIPDIRTTAPIYLGGGPPHRNLHILDFEGVIKDIEIVSQNLGQPVINRHVQTCSPDDQSSEFFPEHPTRRESPGSSPWTQW